MDTFHVVQDKLVAIENQHNKWAHKKLIANSPLNIVHIFIYKKTIFCRSLNFLNIIVEIRLRFLNTFLTFYLFIFFNYLFK